MEESRITRWADNLIDEMGLTKFLTVVGGVCVGGITVGLILLNVIPNNPKIIKEGE